MINTQWIHTGVVLGEMGFTALSQFDDSVSYAELIDMFSPIAGAGVKVALGRGEFGQEMGALAAFQDEFLSGIPGGAIGKRFAERAEIEAGLEDQFQSDPADPFGLVQEQRKAAERKVFARTSMLDMLAPLIATSVIPTVVDAGPGELDAATAQFVRDLSPLEQHERHMDLVRERLQEQSRIVGKELPAAVERSLVFGDLLEKSRLAHIAEGNIDPRGELSGGQTAAGYVQFAIRVAVENGFIANEEAGEYRQRLLDSSEDSTHPTKETTRDIFDDLKVQIGSNDVAAWRGEVNNVVVFRDDENRKRGCHVLARQWVRELCEGQDSQHRHSRRVRAPLQRVVPRPEGHRREH